MDSACWMLSIDSLIVAWVVSSVVKRRDIVPLTMLFGICDAAASFFGRSLGPGGLILADGGVVIPLILSWLAPVLLVTAGVTFLLQRSGVAAGSTLWRYSYLLPPSMAVDNLLFPTRWPIEAGLISGVMAALGFAAGFALWRGAVRPVQRQRLSGALLVTAGCLLAM